MLSHVVILGAGATIAAIPNGDKNGIKSPAMNDFFIRTHMEHLLDDFEIKTTSTNLEDIYSELYENPKYKVISDNTIHLYSNASDMETISKAFMQNNIVITELSVKEQSLEDYYISITGGADYV